MENEAFTTWFDDMQERYQASYGSYEDLLQEAFEAGAKQEREACAKLCDAEQKKNEDRGQWMWEAKTCGIAIRARGTNE